MQAALVHTEFRGVICRYCDKPIKLSKSLVERQTAIKLSEENSTHELHSRVFAMRCRSCHGEAIYSVAEISEFQQGSSTTHEV